MTMRSWHEHLPPGLALTAADLTSEGTLMRAWTRRWGDRPEARLWLEPTPGSRAWSDPSHPPGRWWSAGEFEEATRRAAGRLRAAGLSPGGRVVWSTPSSVASLVAHVGAMRAGLVVVPANTAYSERELAHIVNDVGASAAIVDRPEQAEWVRRAASGPIVVVGSDLDLPDGDPGPIDAAAPDDPALICFTSGTTGLPKGAVLRHRNLLAATESVILAWRWTVEDRLVHCLPIFHAHGLAVGAYGTLLAGASAVLLPGFDPVAVADAAEDHRATLFFGVPTMYHRLVGSGQLGQLSGLRLCVSGSAPLSPRLHGEVTAASGIVVLERYGMTETLMNVSNPYEEERRAGTVGFPLPGVEVRLADDGEILIRGPNVFERYWQRPESEAEAFLVDDGGSRWFRTGDVGEDEDGYLAIRGRTKELIISGGFNVYPREVEDVLATHPGVAEVVVTGTDSPEWGEVVTAWIVPDGRPPSVEELARFTRASLAPYKRPRLVHVVDALPRNALGKVVRSELGS
jgi:malonyl-CoA/methylmalonyl-CoA synthetase